MLYLLDKKLLLKILCDMDKNFQLLNDDKAQNSHWINFGESKVIADTGRV